MSSHFTLHEALLARYVHTQLNLGGLHLLRQLALGSRDLSQAEKKVDVVKPEQIHKIAIIFAQNGQKSSI